MFVGWGCTAQPRGLAALALTTESTLRLVWSCSWFAAPLDVGEEAAFPVLSAHQGACLACVHTYKCCVS